jgi:hypothetical protein
MAQNTRAASKELISASRFQKNARKRACWLMLILCVILTVVLLAVHSPQVSLLILGPKLEFRNWYYSLRLIRKGSFILMLSSNTISMERSLSLSRRSFTRMLKCYIVLQCPTRTAYLSLSFSCFGRLPFTVKMESRPNIECS